MRKRHSLHDVGYAVSFSLKLTVHCRSFVLFRRFVHGEHLDLQAALAEGDLDDIADLDLVAGLDLTAVYRNTLTVAGLISHRSALNKPGHL